MKMFLLVKGTRIHPLGMVSGFHTTQNSDFIVGNNSNFKMILIENAQYRSLLSVKAVTQEQYKAGTIIIIILIKIQAQRSQK
jgi:hypothetical protein